MKNFHSFEDSAQDESETGCIPRVCFPTKLWSAINSDSHLIFWSDDGKSVLVDDVHFEAQIMKVHPGLVRIPSLANFRRQMRWYGFDWNYNRECGIISFTHPSFQKDREDLIEQVIPKNPRRRSRLLNDMSWELDGTYDSPVRITRTMMTGKRKRYDKESCEDIDAYSDTASPKYTFSDSILPQSADTFLRKKRKYIRKAVKQDNGTQTDLTMCSTDTRFLGAIHVDDSSAQDFYKFEDISYSLSRYFSRLCSTKDYSYNSKNRCLPESNSSPSTESSSDVTKTNIQQNFSTLDIVFPEEYSEVYHLSTELEKLTGDDNNYRFISNKSFDSYQEICRRMMSGYSVVDKVNEVTSETHNQQRGKDRIVEKSYFML